MRLQGHLVASGIVGGALAISTGEPTALAIAVGAGVLPDADHAIDFYNWYVRRAPDRLLLLFHGWEYFVAALLLYILVITETWMLAIVVGYGTQIGGDQLFNRPRWSTYLIVMRLYFRFRWKPLMDERPADTAYLSLVRSVPFGRGYLRRWFERRLDTSPRQ